MSKAFRFSSLAWACSVGAWALITAPSISQAAVVNGGNIVVNQIRQYTPLMAEAAPEDVLMYSIVDAAGTPRTFVASEQGDLVLGEELSVTGCQNAYFANINNPLQSWFPGPQLPGTDPDPEFACSDVVRFVNVVGPQGLQGQVWIASDGAIPADLAAIPPLPAGTTNAKFYPAQPQGGEYGIAQKDVVALASDTKHLYVKLRLDSDYVPTMQTGVSDLVSIVVPALPPFAMVGLWVVFASAGAFIALRVRRQSAPSRTA